MSPFDETGGCGPLFFDNLNVYQAKISIAIGINWLTLISSVRTSEGCNEHPTGSHNDRDTNLWVMVELQHSETRAILAEKGVSLEALVMEADAMREIKFLKGKDIWVV